MDGYMTAAQAAKRFGVTRNTVLRWIKEGHLPDSRKKGPGQTSPFIIPIAAIEKLERELQQPKPTS